MGLTFFQGEHRATLEAALKLAEAHGTPFDLELELITAKGNRRWVRSICNPLVENGTVTRVLVPALVLTLRAPLPGVSSMDPLQLSRGPHLQ